MSSRLQILICAALLLAPKCCYAQWSRLSQPDLREISERLVSRQKIEISTPWVKRLDLGFGRIRLAICMGDFPRDLTDDPLFNRVLNAQMQVSLIRVYRNQPAMISNWLTTLETVERHVVEMLKVLASDQLTNQQKSDLLSLMELQIADTYNNFFLRWAQSEGRFDWGLYNTPRKLHTVFLTKSEPGIVKYMCAGPWEMYCFAEKKGLKVNMPTWLEEKSDSIQLAGEYYFVAKFRDSDSEMTTPINVNRELSLYFIPKPK